MKIKLDDKYTLFGDQYCFWINKTVETKKNGKPTGKFVDVRVSGYCPTLETTIDSFIEKRIGGADIEKLSQLSKEIKALKREVRSWKLELKNVQ